MRAARRNGYLASTADAIAVFETSILLLDRYPATTQALETLLRTP